MERRYPGAVVAAGGLLVAVSAAGDWPVADTASLGVEVPVIAVLAVLSVGLIVLAAARWMELIEPRAFASLVFVVAFVTFLFGAYGYAEALFTDYDTWIDEIVGLLPILATLAGAGTAAIGGLGDFLEIDGTSARRRSRATGLMALTGIAGLVLMIVWSQILFLILMLFMGREPRFNEAIVVSNISLGLGMGTVAAFYLLLANRDLSFIDLKLPSLRDIGWMVVGLGGVFMALIAIAGVLQLLGAPPAEHDLVDDITEQGDPDIVLYILIPGSILLIGPGEELLFRNIIQKSLYDYFSRPAAIIIASLLFALAHIPAYWAGADTVTAIIVITTLSLVLGAIYARTENIVVPAIVHGLYNAILFTGLYLEMTMEDAPAILFGLL